MANNTHLYGFRWLGSGGNASDQPPVEEIPIGSHYQPAATGNSVDLRIGDPVRRTSTGALALSVAGEAIYGVLVGFTPVLLSGKMTPSLKWPGGTIYGASSGVLVPEPKRTYGRVVRCMPGQKFQIDCDDASTATTEAAYQALVGENCDHAVPSDISDTANPTANPMLDISTHVTTTAQWRIVDVSRSFWNKDFTGLYVKLIVVCNETQEAPYVTTGV